MINAKIDFRYSEHNQFYFLSGDDNASIGIKELVAWINDDVGRDLPSVDFITGNIKNNIETKPHYSMTGNAHTCTICNGIILINCEFVDEWVVLITFEQIMYLLDQYRSFISNKNYYDKNKILPDPIDIEFVSEGMQAVIDFQNNQVSIG